MSQFEPVLKTQDLGPGVVVEVAAQGTAVALANVGQQYFAMASRCPEDGSSLGRQGRIDGDHLVCPGDHPAYDVRTGAMVDGGDGTLRRFAIRVEENEILVGPPLD
jgi:nitrite reductase/ring-hydroxylating ferredoxin subunit